MKFACRRRSNLHLSALAVLAGSSLLFHKPADAGEPPAVPVIVASKDSPAASPIPAASPAAKLTRAELRAKLTHEQYRVTQENGTERPGKNAYWDSHRAGIYVDIVSGEPLFSSLDKFDSETGWPSFTKPLVKENIVLKTDRSLGFDRTEARSKEGDCHLGHVFDDGPAPTGMRYCVNSAALRFIPKEKLETEGYGKYLPLFAKKNPAKD